MYRLFPYPPQLTHTLTVLMALSTGVAAFVLLRRLDGIGYAIEWRRGFGWHVALQFRRLRRHRDPARHEDPFPHLGSELRARALAAHRRAGNFVLYGVAGGISVSRAAAEFIFANFNNQWAGLIVASLIFGLSHIFHAPYPNWKYVLLATIAGLSTATCG